MTDREINRANLTAFLIRAISHSWANAVDAEFGLRVSIVEALDDGRICIELDDHSVITLAFDHLVPRCASEPSLFDIIKGDKSDAHP